MNVGQAITAAMREQRANDLIRLRRDLTSSEDYHAFVAWLWWGWRLIPTGQHLGMPGATWPWGWNEPKWAR